jgi:hypothetical protein
MTIKEVLKEICDEQIPKEVNGVSTKYFIREYRSVIGNRVVEISILPTNITKDNMGVTHRYSDEFYMDYDYCSGSLGHGRLVEDIRDLLCRYIRNINEWTEGRVVREKRLDLDGDNDGKDDKR